MVHTIYTEPKRCPVCKAEATMTHTLTCCPPINVYSCGCKVTYRTRPPQQPAKDEAVGDDEYLIETLSDLLKIPCEKRGECLRQIEYALDLHDLAFGDTPPLEFRLVWRDDGDKSVDLSVNGEPTLRLEVTDTDMSAKPEQG